MAAAIRLRGGNDAIEIANFIKKMDKSFDCFNVSTFTVEAQTQTFLDPYHFRLAVSIFINTVAILFILLQSSF